MNTVLTRTALAAALALSFTGPALAAQTLRYVALVDDGKQAGHQTVTVGDDGVTRVDYIFKDNGRGPELKEEFTLAPDGTFATYQVKGSTTFGAPVEESFVREGDHARWRSTADQGEQDVHGTAMYTPLNGTPAGGAVAMAVLLAGRADGTLPLIPGGELRMRKVTEMQVARGGEKRTVQLLALTGIGLAPEFVWATTDAKPRLFASIEPGWVSLIEDGWNANAGALEARQKQAEGEALVELNQRVSHPLPGTTLIRNARVFDSEHAKLGAASDVLVRDGRIVSVAAAGSGGEADHVIDGGGRVLLPGLFDMHGHLSRWDGGLNIATGVTTVRDMGNDNASLQQLMAEEKAGTLLATHVVPAGFIEGESRMSARNGFVVRTLDEAKKAVDWYADHGYVQVKIYNSFPKDLLRDTAAYAHAKGLRVSGHVPAFMRAQDVVEQGYDEIQHINQVLLNFLVDDKTDTRTLQRFYLPAEKVADLDFDSKPVQDYIAMLANKQIVVDPTLSTFEFLRQRSGQMPESYAPIASHMPPDIQRGLRSGEMKIPDSATATRYAKSYAKMVEFVGRLYKAGVPLVAGTDALPGFTVQSELEWLVRAGLTPAQALQVATWNGAKYGRVLDDRGSITPGKRADLILVDGDPTANIADIRNVALVLKGDTAYYPSEIFEAIGVKPFAVAVKAESATRTTAAAK